MTSRNQQLFERAQKHIPGGVNSPVRAFRSVGGTPLFFQKGAGAKVQDADGKWYTDYVGSWGPMILGHAHPEVIAAVQAAVVDGLSFGAPTEREVDIADLLCEMVPSMDMVRLVSSGTEATMSAIRLARGFTKRDRLVKFDGCYHGHSDSLLVAAVAVSTPATLGFTPPLPPPAPRWRPLGLPSASPGSTTSSATTTCAPCGRPRPKKWPASATPSWRCSRSSPAPSSSTWAAVSACTPSS